MLNRNFLYNIALAPVVIALLGGCSSQEPTVVSNKKAVDNSAVLNASVALPESALQESSFFLNKKLQTFKASPVKMNERVYLNHWTQSYNEIFEAYGEKLELEKLVVVKNEIYAIASLDKKESYNPYTKLILHFNKTEESFKKIAQIDHALSTHWQFENENVLFYSKLPQSPRGEYLVKILDLSKAHQESQGEQGANEKTTIFQAALDLQATFSTSDFQPTYFFYAGDRNFENAKIIRQDGTVVEIPSVYRNIHSGFFAGYKSEQLKSGEIIFSRVSHPYFGDLKVEGKISFPTQKDYRSDYKTQNLIVSARGQACSLKLPELDLKKFENLLPADSVVSLEYYIMGTKESDLIPVVIEVSAVDQLNQSKKSALISRLVFYKSLCSEPETVLHLPDHSELIFPISAQGHLSLNEQGERSEEWNLLRSKSGGFLLPLFMPVDEGNPAIKAGYLVRTNERGHKGKTRLFELETDAYASHQTYIAEKPFRKDSYVGGSLYRISSGEAVFEGSEFTSVVLTSQGRIAQTYYPTGGGARVNKTIQFPYPLNKFILFPETQKMTESILLEENFRTAHLRYISTSNRPDRWFARRNFIKQAPHLVVRDSSLTSYFGSALVSWDRTGINAWDPIADLKFSWILDNKKMISDLARVNNNEFASIIDGKLVIFKLSLEALNKQKKSEVVEYIVPERARY